MNTGDDDDLGIDLDAWQPPPVPGGIADGVIAKLREDRTSQVSTTPIDPQERKPTRWWIVAGVAAAVASVTTIAFVGVARAPSSGQGSAIADTPQRLDLGPTSAELDRGAAVTWQRERYRITAQQASGTATWHVDADDTLTIDAALASIEATDANLRVEVTMLGTTEEERERTKKTIGTSAATAAVVALVTVVVYNGAVKVTRADKTVSVPAGSAIQIKGDGVVDQEVVVGAAKVDTSLDAEIAAKQAEIDRLIAQIEEAKQKLTQVDPFNPPDPNPCDEVSCVLNNYEGTCCARFKAGVPDGLDRKMITDGVGKVKSKVMACGGGFSGRIKVKVKVNPDGSVASVAATPSDAAPASCIEGVFRDAQFEVTRSGGSFGYPFVFVAPKPVEKTVVDRELGGNPFDKPACDAGVLFQRGMEAFSSGSNGSALAHFEAAYNCRADTRTLKLTFAASCKTKNLAKARQYWKQLSQDMKDSVLQFCVANGISQGDLGGTPDETGRLTISNSKPAHIFLDGKDIGWTPVDIVVTPGKHRVTFVVDGDKYTFAVNAKSGETVTLTKEIN